MLKFETESKRLQTHIVDGKLVENKFLHPLNANPDKTFIIEQLRKIFPNMNIVQQDRSIFRVDFPDKPRFFCVDTTDGGGREDGAQKVSIPFNYKPFKKLLKDNQLVSVMNMYFPLKTVDGGFSIDEENIVVAIISPIQIFAAKGYGEVMNDEGKQSPSSRWVKMMDILSCISNNKKRYLKPKGSRFANVNSQYAFLIPSKLIDEKIFKQFEMMDINDQVLEWVMSANQLSKSSQKLINKIYNASQKIFRDSLLAEDGHKCAVEGCNVSQSDLLIASHIKPRAATKSENISLNDKVKQLSDPTNGFMLCRKHDAPFDRGYISFSDSGKVLFNKEKISDLFASEEKINDKIFSSKNQEYLRYHREHVFQNNPK